MALQVGALEVRLVTQMDQFIGGMRSAANAVDQSGQRISASTDRAARSVSNLERSTRNFGGDAFRPLLVSALRAEGGLKQLQATALLIPAAVGGISAAFATRSLMQYADAATNVRNRLAVLTESQAERVRMEREIFDIAQRTRSEYGATAQLYSRTTQAAQALGRAQGDIAKFVEAVQMSAQISGATTQESQAAAIQLAQGLSSGRFQGDELRSVLENNIALAQVLADELAGGSTGRLRDMGSEGLLTPDKVLDAVLRNYQRLSTQFGQTQTTFQNGFVILNNAVTRYVGQVDQGIGATQAFVSMMQSLADNLPEIAKWLGVITASLLALGAVRSIGAIKDLASGSDAARIAPFIAEKAARAEAATAAGMGVTQAQGRAMAANAAYASAARKDPIELASRASIAEIARAEGDLRAIQQARQAVMGRIFKEEDRLAQERIGLTKAVADATLSGEAAVARAAEGRRRNLQSEIATLAKVEAQEVKRQNSISRLMTRAEDQAQRVFLARQGVEGSMDGARERIAADRARVVAKETRAYDQLAKTTAKADASLSRLNQRRKEAEGAALMAARSMSLGQGDQASVQRAYDRLSKIEQQIAKRQAQRTDLTVSSRTQMTAVEAARQAAAMPITQVEASTRAMQTLARETERLDAIRRQIAAREASGGVIGSALTFQRAAVDEATALTQRQISIDQAQIENANAVVRAKERIAEQEQRVAEARRRLGTIESAAVLQQGRVIEPARDAARATAMTELNRLAVIQREEQNRVAIAMNDAAGAQMRAAIASAELDRQNGFVARSIGMVSGAASSLVAFLGGPWGVAFIAATAAITYFGFRTAETARQIREAEETLRSAGQMESAAPEERLSAIQVQIDQANAKIQEYRDQLASWGDSLNAPLERYSLFLSKQAPEIQAFVGQIQGLNATLLEGSISYGEYARGLEAIKEAQPSLAPLIDEMLETAKVVGANNLRLRELSEAVRNLDGQRAEINVQINVDGMGTLQSAIRMAQSATLANIARNEKALQQDADAKLGEAYRQAGASRVQADRDRQAFNEEMRQARIPKEERRLEEMRGRFSGVPDADLRQLIEAESAGRSKGGGGGGRRRGGGGRSSGGGGGGPSAFEKAQQSINERIAEMQFETATIGQNVVELERARAARDLLTAAMDGNKRLTQENREKLTGLIIASATATDRASRQTAAEQLLAAAKAAGVPITQASIDATMKQAEALGLATQKAEEAQAAQERLQRSQEELRAFSQDVLGGFVRDLRQGVSATEALENALDKVADRLLDLAINGFIDMIFPSSNGGGGSNWLGGIASWIGGLFGFGGGDPFANMYHSGGKVGANDNARVRVPAGVFSGAPRFHAGLNSNEFPAILERGERVLTEVQDGRTMSVINGLASAASSGGGATFVNVNVINNTGSRVSTEEQKNSSGGVDLRVMIDEMTAGNIAKPGSRSRQAMQTGFGLGGQLARR